MGLVSIFCSHLPLPGLEAPQDLEAKEVTPRTALLTWTEPQVPPTSYLLSFNTPGGQTQVPPPLPHWPTPLPGPPLGGTAPSSASPSGAPPPSPLTCSLCVPQEILLPGGVTSHQLLGLFPSTPYSVWLRAMWGESLTPPVSTSFTTGIWALGPKVRG